jgi:hypothetical protein
MGMTDMLPADWPGSTKEEKSVETLLIFGGPVKTLGSGKVGGYLVQFGDAAKTDLTGDYFTADTDFDVEFPGVTAVYYNHALDANLKSRKLGKGELTPDEVGVWVEAQLQLRDDYEKAIYKMADEGKLGWSSGTAAHLVERERVGTSQAIRRWPLGLDASLTPTPAEPRNAAFSLKSWIREIDPEEETEPANIFECMTERDIEKWLREAGHMRRDARDLIHQIKTLSQREASDDDIDDSLNASRQAYARVLEARLKTGVL